MSIAQALENLPFFSNFADSVLVYPIVLSIHLTDIALFGGMIFMTNLRLLGLTFNQYTITQMVTALRPWKRLGGTVQISTGLLLATSEATKYAPNPYFWTKMIILGLIGLHGLIFRPIVYNNTEALDKSPVIPAPVKLAAILSLILWTAMFTMGRLIGYWEGPPPSPQVSELVVLGTQSITRAPAEASPLARRLRVLSQDLSKKGVRNVDGHAVHGAHLQYGLVKPRNTAVGGFEFSHKLAG